FIQMLHPLFIAIGNGLDFNSPFSIISLIPKSEVISLVSSSICVTEEIEDFILALKKEKLPQ
uniref:hypothetical protein n=1 Tax=Candidatus Karelsulcia muelleri TaxID=336810 RepID=UPI00209476CD